jgi:hypothetical protein
MTFGLWRGVEAAAHAHPHSSLARRAYSAATACRTLNSICATACTAQSSGETFTGGALHRSGLTYGY